MGLGVGRYLVLRSEKQRAGGSRIPVLSLEGGRGRQGERTDDRGPRGMVRESERPTDPCQRQKGKSSGVGTSMYSVPVEHLTSVSDMVMIGG